MPTLPLRACIIGAGPSGLCSLRNLMQSDANIEATVFEQQDDIGGIWNYTGAEVKLWDCNGNPVIFPMYSSLRCNLPMKLMEFTDLTHTNRCDTFAKQQDIHNYLLKYANHFRLWPNINLNRKVVNVKPMEKDKWLVTVEDTATFSLRVHTFDAIMCCVGVNFHPNYPSIRGMEKFQGLIIHSKYYKESKDFRGKRVVCLGLGPSCADLCLQLAPVAKQVVACHRFPGGFSLGIVPKNVRETASVAKVREWSIITENNEEIKCDVLILCTGYEVQFPFLDSSLYENELDLDNNIVNCLYQQMIIPKYPSLCFINAHGLTSEFLVMEIQTKYFVGILEGKIFLPSLALMENSVLKTKQNYSHKRSRKLTELLRGEGFALEKTQNYLQSLAREGGFSQEFAHVPLQLAVYQWVIGRIFGSLNIYRHDQLRVITPTVWEYTCAVLSDNGQVDKGVVKMFQLKQDGSVVVKEVTPECSNGRFK